MGGSRLRDRLRGPRPVFGTWVNSRAPEVTETIGAVGFDAVVLDMEHGEFGPEALPDLLRAADAAGCHTLVRTSHVAPWQVAKALDAGAEGVIVPNLRTPQEATAVVRAAHYAPRGARGAAPNGRGPRYGATPFEAYRERIEEDVVVVAQIEGPEGMANVETILDVDGLDVVFIGPFDLSQHLGVPGDTGHPRVVEAMRHIVAAAARRGVATGTWAPTATLAEPWIRAGVSLITVSSSTALFTDAASALLADLRTASR